MKGLSKIFACLLVLVAFYDAASAGGDVVLCSGADGGSRIETAWEQADCRTAGGCESPQGPVSQETIHDASRTHESMELSQGVGLPAGRSLLSLPTFPPLPLIFDGLPSDPAEFRLSLHRLAFSGASDPLWATRASIDSVILLI